MMLEILYLTMYDYTMECYHRDSHRTQIVKAGSVPWDGESDFGELLRAKEAVFLSTDHSTTDAHSWDHRNHRIAVTGLRPGGEHGLVFVPPGGRMLIEKLAKVEAETA